MNFDQRCAQREVLIVKGYNFFYFYHNVNKLQVQYLVALIEVK